MIKKLYAANYPQRREETFLRAAGRCENILVGKERCPVKLGDWRITHSKQLQFEQLIIHHPNGDPENPDAEMIAICWSCHMRLHRRPGPGRTKASAKKRGYEVVRVPYLLEQLRAAGFHTERTEDGRLRWQIGDLTWDANDPLEAIQMALHWMHSEILSLRSKVEQTELPTETPTKGNAIFQSKEVLAHV